RRWQAGGAGTGRGTMGSDRRAMLAAAAALLTAAAAPAVAQTPPEGLVWLALRDINAAYFDPDDPTNRPPLATEPPPGMIRAVVVCDAGRPDWLIDYGRAGLARYCGTGGCRQRLYVSHPDGYVRAFDAQAFDLSFHDRGGERRLEARVHHGYC